MVKTVSLKSQQKKPIYFCSIILQENGRPRLDNYVGERVYNYIFIK